MKLKSFILTLISLIISIVGLAISVSANYPASMIINDNLHILNSSQRQTIIATNNQWAKQKNHPQIWVYTYKKLPKECREDLSSQMDINFNPYNPVDQSAGEFPLEIVTDKYGHKVSDETCKPVSMILTFPYRGKYHTVFIPGDKMSIAISDFQFWLLRLGAPVNSGNAAGVMKDFHRYGKIVDHQVAGHDPVKTGIGWALLSFLFVFPLMVWGFFKLFPHPIKDLLTSDPSYENFGASIWFWNHNGGWW